ncbi:ABC transporter substrate-binding protein [Nakamurella aerolata]|uniref:ABC transporter substrate-binding protein n=1 Tax=Nakamurella aerolata TaxID=1656892 RepID=A0A849A8C7_9ACTN|nr:ABC transporter substrate-binding protein [Nakamurella aerolata]
MAAGVALALTTTACSSDPTNPNTGGNNAGAGTTTAPAGSGADGGQTAASGADSGSGAAGSGAPGSGASGSGAGASGAPSSGGAGAGAGGAGPTGEPAQPGQAAADAKGTLNLFMYQKPNGLFNPLAGASGPDNEVISLMYQPLLGTDAKTGQLVPELAESMPEVSDDAKTFTFKLKKGLTWSDGKPFTSKDVLTTYQFAANPTMENGPFVNFTQVDGYKDLESGKSKTISGITAPDDSTIVIKLSEPSNGLVNIIASIRILPDHVISKLPIKTFTQDPYFRAPKVGIGPFIVDKYDTDQQVHLTANPNFRYKIGVKDVFLKILTSDVATQQLQTGEIDVSNIAPVDMETVKGFNDVSVTAKEAPGFVRAVWNQSQDRFKDPRVKQAFFYGVDRKAIVEGALQNQGVVRNSVYGAPWQAPDLDQYPYDPEKAKQLLADAKFDTSKPIKLSWIAGGNPDRDAAAQIIQNQLKQVGLNIQLDQVQGSWFSENVPKAKFDMVIYGGGDYTSNPYNAIPITSCQKPGGGPNNGLYCNQKYQDTAIKADRATTPEEAKSLYQQASKMENEDPSQMWLYSPKIVWATSGKVQNFVPPLDLGANWWEPWKWTKTG